VIHLHAPDIVWQFFPHGQFSSSWKIDWSAVISKILTSVCMLICQMEQRAVIRFVTLKKANPGRFIPNLSQFITWVDSPFRLSTSGTRAFATREPSSGMI
jgi:hypothetical protein